METAPGRFSHYLELHAASEIDAEVKGWLRTTWEGAGQKNVRAGFKTRLLPPLSFRSSDKNHYPRKIKRARKPHQAVFQITMSYKLAHLLLLYFQKLTQC